MLLIIIVINLLINFTSLFGSRFHTATYTSQLLISFEKMRVQWQVQYGGFWWDIPQNISDEIEHCHAIGSTLAVYTYDWGYERQCNFTDPQTGEPTTIGRYKLNFETKMQINMDDPNAVERCVRKVYLEQ